VAEIVDEISSSEDAIDDRLSRFRWMPEKHQESCGNGCHHQQTESELTMGLTQPQPHALKQVTLRSLLKRQDK